MSSLRIPATASRRHAEELIQEGVVKVNGKVVTVLGTKVDPDRDQVVVGKKLVVATQKGMAIFHKPRGVVSTMSDPEGRPSIADYLNKQVKGYYPVGRLDWDSSGLIILTNDGELADALMHPRYGIKRVYHARVEGSVSERTLEKLSKGIKLADGFARAEASIISNDDKSTWIELTITEGRNRLVRRMMDKLHHPVMKLQRISHGPFRLGKQKAGEIRKLTEKDYKQLRTRILSKIAKSN